MVDWGSRLRGYHHVAPRPLRYEPFVHRLEFRPSSSEAGPFGQRFWLPRRSQVSFTCRKSATWDRRLYFPRKIRQLRLGSNTRFWVPESSMLTTRPPKPLYNYSLQTGLHVKAILGTWRKIVTHSQTTVLTWASKWLSRENGRCCRPKGDKCTTQNLCQHNHERNFLSVIKLRPYGRSR
jgi:hypothetical protein